MYLQEILDSLATIFIIFFHYFWALKNKICWVLWFDNLSSNLANVSQYLIYMYYLYFIYLLF